MRAFFGCGGLVSILVAVSASPSWADAGASVSAGPREVMGVTDNTPPANSKPAPQPRTVGFKSKSAQVGEVRLPALDSKKLVADEAAQPQFGKRLRVAVGRPIVVTAADGRWTDMPDGSRVWTVDIVSEQAKGVRLHIADANLPPGAELLVYSPTSPGDVAGPYRARGPRESGEFRTTTVFGDTVRIEYRVPAGVRGIGIPFSIDDVQHVYRDVPRAGEMLKSAGPCHNDVTCFSAWAETAKGVGRITFVSGGDTFLCTGQLLNSLNSDLTPYFLTANHCINTETEADSVEVFWLFQTAACDGASPSENSVPRSTSAHLLATSAGSDFTLLMIEGSLPSGLSWVGWTANAVPDGTASACVHHPSGDFKRISFGNKSSTTSCGPTNSVRLNWTDGPTEEGSSGSGCYRADTKQLFGQLSCGPSACGSETNDDFGSFATAFDQIDTLLEGGSDDAFEENDDCAAAHAVSNGTYNDRIVKKNDEDWYRLTVAAGDTLFVKLTFEHGFGDVDCRLFDACGGNQLASSLGTTDEEDIEWTNSGGSSTDVFLRVFLAGGVRNVYRLQISNDPIMSGGGCAAQLCGFCLVPLPMLGIGAGLTLMKWRMRRRVR